MCASCVWSMFLGALPLEVVWKGVNVDAFLDGMYVVAPRECTVQGFPVVILCFFSKAILESAALSASLSWFCAQLTQEAPKRNMLTLDRLLALRPSLC